MKHVKRTKWVLAEGGQWSLESLKPVESWYKSGLK